MTPSIVLGERRVSADHPCYIIAEIGVNHNGDVELAHQLIDAAVQTGADAVKFQTYVTDELVVAGAVQADYQARNIGFSSSQADMLRQYELPFSVFKELRDHCRTVGIDFISTAFDAKSLDFVISLQPVCLKWASGELTNRTLLEQAAESGLPMLLSTGMSSFTEVSRAVDWLNNRMPLVILQCVSNYPAAIEDQNLRVLETMRAAFGCPTGFSDHTPGPYAALVARGLGMAVLEKHFTLDVSLPGPDHRASIEPAAFTELVSLVRAVEAGLGDGVKRLSQDETNTRDVARRSLVYRYDLPQGHQITMADLTSKRPGTGLAPDQLERLLGRTLVQDVLLDQLADPAHVR
jgi:sialic acid synthase SpsE